MIEQINEKWSEEMPCLYDMAMFIQDELMEQYFETNGYPDTEENGKPTITFKFDNAQIA